MESLKSQHILETIGALRVTIHLIECKEYDELEEQVKHLEKVKALWPHAVDLKTDIAKIIRLISERKYKQAIKKGEGVLSYLEYNLYLFQCDQKWEDLLPTKEEKVRFCQTCSKNIHQVDNAEEFEERASQNQCVFYSKEYGFKSFRGTSSFGPRVLLMGKIDFGWPEKFRDYKQKNDEHSPDEM